MPAVNGFQLTGKRAWGAAPYVRRPQGVMEHRHAGFGYMVEKKEHKKN